MTDEADKMKMPERIWVAEKTLNSYEQKPETNPILADLKTENTQEYIHKDTLIEMLEDDKHSEMAEKNGLYCAGYNAAIQSVIDKIKGE